MGVLTGAFLAVALTAGVHPAKAAYSARVQAGTLKLTGDAADDKLALRLRGGAPGTLEVDVGEDGTADFAFDRSTFTAIDVQAGPGDDEVGIDQSGGTFTDEDITINGGAGNDTLIGGSGAETFNGGLGDDFVDGNQGADTAQLGGGDDRFQWDPGDGSDTIEGQAGRDELDFNGSNAGEKIELSANGSRLRLTRDIANITMDMDGVERTNIRALGGTDAITVGDLSGTDAKTIAADIDGFGGAGDSQPDTVTVQGTAAADQVKLGNDGAALVVSGLAAETSVTGGETALDNIVVAGLAGDDTLTAAVGVTGPTPVTFDGGEGTDATRFDGTQGDDQISVARNGSAAATFAPAGVIVNTIATVESLEISGLGGNDTIAGSNGIAEITKLTIAGGEGNDTLGGGDGADLLLGGPGDDFVDGNRGEDLAQLGPGDDHFQWDPGDGSDTVEGQGGHDQLDFNGSNAGEKIELSANGPRLRLTRDIANITMDVDRIDRVNLRMLGGTDGVDVRDLAGTAVKTVDVDLAATGGGGDGAADTVTVDATADADKVKLSNADDALVVGGLVADTRVRGGETANDNIVVAGLAGDDTLTATVGVSGSTPVTFDGGDGVDATNFDGTSGDDQISIVRNGSAAAAFAPGGVIVNTISTVESLLVDGRDGNDTILGSNGLADITKLTLDGGDGNDTLGGGDGADLLLGGPGDDLVDGNRGQDVAQLGAGDDHFQWDPGDGSDVVEGQGGDDQLDFNGSNAGEKIELSANGSRLRLTRDVASITMDADGIEHVSIRALGSTDQIEVGDLGSTKVKSVDVDLGASAGGGDGAADTVIVDGTSRRDVVAVTRTGSQISVTGLPVETRIVGSEAANDTLRIQTLEGDDEVTVAPDVSDLIAAVVDLGADD